MFRLKSQSKQKGFTLVELLVVISLIGILSAIGLVVYSGVGKNSRDLKRKTDLAQIQSALEHYHADAGYYPPVTALVEGSPIQFVPPSGPTKKYLNEVPKDPTVAANKYTYRVDPSTCTGTTNNSCQKYCLSARLEGSSVDTACTDTPAAYNYSIRQP